MCFGCYGIFGYCVSFFEIYQVLMLDGQNVKYIVVVLMEYVKGECKYLMMNGIVKLFSEQDMVDIVVFYEQWVQVFKVFVEVLLVSVDVIKFLEKGVCFICYGKNFSMLLIGVEFKLVGQYVDYFYVVLKFYQMENNNVIGCSNVVMGVQVKQFSYMELCEIVNYFGLLFSELCMMLESCFC